MIHKKLYGGIDKFGFGGLLPGGAEPFYETDEFEKMTRGAGFFAAKRARKALKQQAIDVEGRIPGIEEYFDQLLGQTEFESGLQEKSLLDDFLDQSFTFKRKSEVEQGQTGLAFSGELVAEQERQQGLMRGQFGIQRQQIGSSLEMDKLGIGKSRIDELQNIQDLLYQIETSRESFV